MTLRKIAQLGEPVLRRRAAEVPAELLASREMQTLVDDMIDTMRDANGAGIAAPQVFESVRVSVIEVHGNPRYPDFPAIPLLVLVNPVVRPAVGVAPLRDEDAIQMYEGCLSVAGVRGRVRRPRRVTWSALDRAGRPIEGTWEGVPAAILQHETDHLDGVLFVDRVEPTSLTFLEQYDRHVPRDERIRDGRHVG